MWEPGAAGSAGAAWALVGLLVLGGCCRKGRAKSEREQRAEWKEAVCKGHGHGHGTDAEEVECGSLEDGTVLLDLEPSDPSTTSTQMEERPERAARHRIRFSSFGQLRNVPRDQLDQGLPWDQHKERQEQSDAPRLHVYKTIARIGGHLIDWSVPKSPAGKLSYVRIKPRPNDTPTPTPSHAASGTATETETDSLAGPPAALLGKGAKGSLSPPRSASLTGPRHSGIASHRRRRKSRGLLSRIAATFGSTPAPRASNDQLTQRTDLLTTASVATPTAPTDTTIHTTTRTNTNTLQSQATQAHTSSAQPTTKRSALVKTIPAS